MSLNYTILIGRLVRDPEHRLTSTGVPITRFTIAVDKIKRPGEEKQADFIRVTAWRRLAEICNQFLKKGKLVAVEGRLQVDHYESNGEQRESVEVIADNMQMLDRGENFPENANPGLDAGSAAPEAVSQSQFSV